MSAESSAELRRQLSGNPLPPTDGVAGAVLVVSGEALTTDRDDLRRAVAACRSRGLRAHVAVTDPAPGVDPVAATGADTADQVGGTGGRAWETWAAARGRPVAVLGLGQDPGGEGDLATALAAAAAGAPGNPPAAVLTTRDGAKAREALAAARLPQPPWLRVADLAGARAFLRAVPGPWLVGPAERSGRHGTTRVADPADLAAAVLAATGGGQRPFLVAGVAEGPAYVAMGVFLDAAPRVLLVAEAEPPADGRGPARAYRVPAELPATTRALVEAAAVAAVDALGLRHGLFEVAVRLDAGGPAVGEVHPRLPPAWGAVLLGHAVPGLDPVALVLDDALGQDRATPRQASRGAAVRFAVAGPGRVRRVEGWPAVTRHPGVLAARLLLRPGAVATARPGGERVAAVLVGSASSSAAASLADQLVTTLHVVTDQADQADQADTARRVVLLRPAHAVEDVPPAAVPPATVPGVVGRLTLLVGPEQADVEVAVAVVGVIAGGPGLVGGGVGGSGLVGGGVGGSGLVGGGVGGSGLVGGGVGGSGLVGGGVGGSGLAGVGAGGSGEAGVAARGPSEGGVTAGGPGLAGGSGEASVVAVGAVVGGSGEAGAAARGVGQMGSEAGGAAVSAASGASGEADVAAGGSGQARAAVVGTAADGSDEAGVGAGGSGLVRVWAKGGLRGHRGAVLAGAGPLSLGVGATTAGPRGIGLLLPGLGEQHPDMAAGLYRDFPGFAATVDHCAEVLRPELRLDIRTALFTAAGARPGGGLDLRALLGRGGERPPVELDRTDVAQSALFTVEYALARLLRGWGARPEVMLGHGLGEHVAACLAGVLSLEDSLLLVARRGALIESLPAGAMLAVGLPEAELAPLLIGSVALAAVNGPDSCVVAGTVREVAEQRAVLTCGGVAVHPVRARHACHTPLMAPIADQLTEVARGLRHSAPRVPYVATATGELITDAEAVDPGHWARHLTSPVRFADGLRVVAEGRVLVEAGPGQGLSSLAVSASGGAVAAMRHALDPRDDTAVLLTALGRLWLANADLDWTALLADDLPDRPQRTNR
ncbi:acyltransferase domain-containing protein [Actinokineospora sp. G85]|uniref:acyltransferase domain-containing protein n=1 Tax=Actinokineospora sp. G85 TaxID=3406626 RepID=UPI003C73D74B